MTLIQMMKRFPTEESCIEYLEVLRWGKERQPVCPYCGHRTTRTKRTDGRYHCGSCNRAFSVTVGTIFHKTHQSLQQWFLLVILMLNAKKGESGHNYARDIGVPQPTVWRMTMKIRKAMASDQGPLLQGIVEIDETYVGGKPRKPNGGPGTGTRGRGTKKTAVIGMVERGGNVQARTIDTVSRATIQAFIDQGTDNATIYSDAYKAYRKISDVIVDHGYNFVDKDGNHTNNIESFWAIVKRGLFGQFHHVKKRYLDAYLAEFSYRFNRRFVDCSFDETVAWMVRG